MTGKLKKALSGAALMLVWILLWEIVTLYNAGSYAAAPPHRVIAEFISGAAGPYWAPLWSSFKRILTGYFLALMIGTTIGVMVASSKFCEWMLGGVILGIQSLPSICWLPVAILWFGLNEKAIVFVVLMGSIGSITLASRDGLRMVSPIYNRVSATFGARPWQRLFWVALPAALPQVISGLKQGWSFAWRSLMAGELLYHSTSLGSLLSDARDLADYPRMYAVMLLIIFASVCIDKAVFAQLESRIRRRWGLVEQGTSYHRQ